jgi:hypothetical protein
VAVRAGSPADSLRDTLRGAASTERWTTITAIALVSLACAGCASGENQSLTGPAPEAQTTTPAEALRAAAELLDEMCLTGPVLDEGEETPMATDVVVDDLIRAFYLVNERSSVEDDVREALGLLADGCASSSTARRLAVATGVDADDLAEAGDDLLEEEAFDCDAQGINIDEGQGGTCVDAAGRRVTVVDRGETATTPALEVTLLDVQTPRTLSRDGEASRRADGIFVLLDLEVRNRLEEPVEFDSAGQVELMLDGQPYFSAEDGTTTIDPGEERTGTVAFDVPEDVVGALETNGNVFVLPFPEADSEGEQATVAVLRTYE